MFFCYVFQLFRYCAQDSKVYDLTATNRAGVEDAKDSGGRIGPYINKGDPDLRNLALTHHQVEEGDIIIVVSDGVHDNMDPATLGLVPSNFNQPGNDYASWKNIPMDQKVIIQTQYMCETIEKIIGKIKNPNVVLVAKAIIDHAIQVTDKSRDYMEQNFNSLIAGQSYSEYPGKMDHCSCVAIKVGPVSINESKYHSLNHEVFPF